MDKYILECCVDSVASAIEAEKGGADRLELCSNLIIGGTTPTLALFNEVRNNVSIPINVLIRPRFGDFLYSEYEGNMIKQEVVQFREAGADAVVIGNLTADGNLDIPQMKELIALAGDMKITLHRAFDMCADPMKTLQDAIDLDIDTILTSGQKDSWKAGLPLLKQLDEMAKSSDLQIMAGAGVNADAIKTMLAETDIHCFHMSGKEVLESGMTYRNPDVHMGIPGFSEFQVWQTSAEEIRKAKEVLRKI